MCSLQFVCSVDDLNRVKGKLTNKNYTIETFEEAYIPKSPVEVDEAEQQELDKLLDQVDELEVVEKIVSNVQWSKINVF